MTKWWNIHTWIFERWSRKVSFFCFQHEREFLIWCTCSNIANYKVKKNETSHVDTLSGIPEPEGTSGSGFDSLFWTIRDTISYDETCFTSLLYVISVFAVSSDEILYLVWRNNLSRLTKSRLTSACIEIHFFFAKTFLWFRITKSADF